MKQILKLDSVGEGTIGGPSCQAISVMYSYLLQELKQDYFSYILVNHIKPGELEEQVVRLGGRQIGVNVIYDQGGDISSGDEPNLLKIQSDIIFKGLTMISSETGKLNIANLEAIRHKMHESNYSIEIPAITYKAKAKHISGCFLSVVPKLKEFDFFINLYWKTKEKLNHLRYQVFSGQCSIHYIAYFFKHFNFNGSVIELNGDVAEVRFLVNINYGNCYIVSEHIRRKTGIVWELMSAKLQENCGEEETSNRQPDIEIASVPESSFIQLKF
jgi:hypothetical protein